MIGSILRGFQYLCQGFQLSFKPELRKYFFIPLALNIILVICLYGFIYKQVESLLLWVQSFLPDFLIWLSWLIIPLVLLLLFVSFSTVFILFLSTLAAPFNSLLAERAFSYILTQSVPTSTLTWQSLLLEPWRRQWQKIKYIIPRLLLCNVGLFIPVIGQILTPILSFILSAWVLAIEYSDYHFEHQSVSFQQAIKQIQSCRMEYFGFGLAVLFCTMIPVINLFIMPAAICGATLFWRKHHQNLNYK
tara:strand:+ start:2709 stop:3449 length:741 start_codon:yes stop_codon:yes gene_type:complete